MYIFKLYLYLMNNIMNKRRDRFLRIAKKRTQRVIDNIESLSKCSNTSNYEYSKEDVNKMISAINKSIIKLKNSFETENKTKFNF